MSVLQTVFKKIAALPLIGPHDEQEVELMLAGAKPVTMLWPHPDEQEKIDRLDQAVRDGKLISRPAIHRLERSYTLYCHPDYADSARELLSLETVGDSARDKELRQILGLDRFYHYEMTPLEKARLAIAKYQTDFMTSSKGYQHEQKAYQHFALRLLKEGTIKAYYIPQWQEKDPKAINAFEEACAAGTIQHHSITRDISTAYMIYGQHGQEENMERLEQLNRQAADPDDPKNSFAAILGYSDRDEDYFANRDTMPFLKNYLLEKTAPLRRDLRIQMMLNEGPNWKRNP